MEQLCYAILVCNACRATFVRHGQSQTLRRFRSGVAYNICTAKLLRVRPPLHIFLRNLPEILCNTKIITLNGIKLSTYKRQNLTSKH